MRSPSATSSAGTVHMTTMLVLPTSDMADLHFRHGGQRRRTPECPERLDVRSLDRTADPAPRPSARTDSFSGAADADAARRRQSVFPGAPAAPRPGITQPA